MGLFCLPREFSLKIGVNFKSQKKTHKNDSGPTQMIMMGESIRHIRVKKYLKSKNLPLIMVFGGYFLCGER